MQKPERVRQGLKWVGLVVLALVAGIVGAAVTARFGTSSVSISYIDFLSVMLTSLGVMLTIVTLFVGVLAVLGWTSIESRLRSHSIEFIGSELDEEKPLGRMIRKAVRDAVYEGVGPPAEEDEAYPAQDEEPAQ